MSKHREVEDIAFAIITCSDTRDESNDTAGAKLSSLVKEKGWSIVMQTIVKDDRETIGKTIIDACDEYKADIVITCGGTGLSPRDVTPEATQDVCDRDVPGIAEAMRAYSLNITANAMLSRARCMQRGSTIVLNFPGSKKAALENWEAVVNQLDHAVSMARGGGH